MAAIDVDSDNFVTITVNIMTKHNGVRRFEVKTELKVAFQVAVML